MLIPRRAEGERAQQGSGAGSLAELRGRLADPSALTNGHRQRLLELVRRAARVQALGDEYAGVGLSDYVTTAMDRPTATV
jgi:hypothetical protein